MADLVVYVHVLETRTGEWCPVCLLPSAITVVTGISTKENEPPGPGGPRMSKTWCTACAWDPAMQRYETLPSGGSVNVPWACICDMDPVACEAIKHPRRAGPEICPECLRQVGHSDFGAPCTPVDCDYRARCDITPPKSGIEVSLIDGQDAP